MIKLKTGCARVVHPVHCPFVSSFYGESTFKHTLRNLSTRNNGPRRAQYENSPIYSWLSSMSHCMSSSATAAMDDGTMMMMTTTTGAFVVFLFFIFVSWWRWVLAIWTDTRKFIWSEAWTFSVLWFVTIKFSTAQFHGAVREHKSSSFTHKSLRNKQLDATVTTHSPCAMRNTLRNYSLLDAIIWTIQKSKEHVIYLSLSLAETNRIRSSRLDDAANIWFVFAEFFFLSPSLCCLVGGWRWWISSLTLR